MYNHRAVLGSPGSASDNRTPPQGAIFSSAFFASECWVGAYRDNGFGVTMYSPDNSNHVTGQFGERYGNAYSNASSYISNGQQRNYDNDGVYDDYGYIILGTENEARAKIATLPPPDQTFNFNFSQTNVFSNHDARVKREPDGRLIWHVGDSKTDNGVTSTIGNMMSPARAWVASNLSSISFDMTVSGVSSMQFKWRKPGIANQFGTEFTKTIAVIGDGVRRTYTVNTSDPNWNGIITSAGLGATNGQTPAGSTAVVHHFFKN